MSTASKIKKSQEAQRKGEAKAVAKRADALALRLENISKRYADGEDEYSIGLTSNEKYDLSFMHFKNNGVKHNDLLPPELIKDWIDQGKFVFRCRRDGGLVLEANFEPES